MQPIDFSIRQFILDLPQVKRVLVACSGGVDSTVLLHCVAKAGLTCPVAAVHVNHQLSIYADAWQQQVQDLCARLNVECYHQRVDVLVECGGVEQAARQARYGAFESYLREGDLLLTAHHQQDQAETFFLRLLRGAGLRGLSAMAPVRAHGDARIGRPLLQHTKEELFAYAHCHGLQWVEDDSNQQVIFDRNFLRAQVMPLLQQRWPQALQQVSRSTQLLQEADALLSHYAEHDVALCEPRVERVGQSLLLEPLLNWSEPRRNHVIRVWLTSLGYRLPERKQCFELARVLTAQADKCPVLRWQDCEIRRFQQRLYCLPRSWETVVSEVDPVLQWVPELCTLPQRHLNCICAAFVERGLRPGRDYIVKPRSRCPDVKRAHPASRGHSQSLKKLLQEYQVEPWLRPWVPLIFSGNELVAVADLWVEQGHLYQGEQALGLAWQITPMSGRL